MMQPEIQQMDSYEMSTIKRQNDQQQTNSRNLPRIVPLSPNFTSDMFTAVPVSPLSATSASGPAAAPSRPESPDVALDINASLDIISLHCEMEGELYLKNSSLFTNLYRSWKCYYAVITSSHLQLFQDKSKKKLVKEISLKLAHISNFIPGLILPPASDSDQSSDKYTFGITSGGKQFIFKAINEDSMISWLMKLKIIAKCNIDRYKDSTVKDVHPSAGFNGNVRKAGWVLERGKHVLWTLMFMMITDEKLFLFESPPKSNDDMKKAWYSRQLIDFRPRILETSELFDLDRKFCMLLSTDNLNLFLSTDSRNEIVNWKNAINGTIFQNFEDGKCTVYQGSAGVNNILLELNTADGIVERDAKNKDTIYWKFHPRLIKSFEVRGNDLYLEFGRIKASVTANSSTSSHSNNNSSHIKKTSISSISTSSAGHSDSLRRQSAMANQLCAVTLKQTAHGCLNAIQNLAEYLASVPQNNSSIMFVKTSSEKSVRFSANLLNRA